MTKLWDDLKKNMKDWSSAAVEKAEEVSKLAVAKTEELTKISKEKIAIHQLERDQIKLYEKIGKLVFEHSKSNEILTYAESADIKNLFGQVAGLSVAIKEKEGKIQKIREMHDIDEQDLAEVVPEPEESVEEDTGAKK